METLLNINAESAEKLIQTADFCIRDDSTTGENRAQACALMSIAISLHRLAEGSAPVAEVIGMNQENTTRTFPDVINEWTDRLIQLNKDATLEQVGLILHLGTLGQRLMFEANMIGQNEVLRLAKLDDVKVAAGLDAVEHQ